MQKMREKEITLIYSLVATKTINIQMHHLEQMLRF